MGRPSGVSLLVTAENYAAYLGERDAFLNDPAIGRRSNGVGPAQLTWYGLQDEADRLGGCWDPYANCLVAFRILRAHREAQGNWTDAFHRYNGLDKPRSQYAEPVNADRLRWRKLLGGD
jgi:hypothetical protein